MTARIIRLGFLLLVAIRQIGVDRILYGDGPVFGNWQPAEAWAAFGREILLTNDEFAAIAKNVAPYLLD